jgi:dipeptidyl aminopeptidase/acylaminoacyl peptidase
MPDSNEVLTTTLPEGSPPDAKQTFPVESFTSPQNLARTPGSTVVVYTSQLVSAKNGSNPTSDPWVLENNLDLVLVNIRTSEVKRLVRNRSISQYSPSPDGSYVAFTTPKRFEKPGSQQILWDLSIVALSTGQEFLVASEVRFDYDGASFSWSPDSLHVAYLTGGRMEFEAGHGDCFLGDLSGGPPRNITNFRGNGPRQRQRRPLWNAAGKSVYLIRGDSVWTADVFGITARQLAVFHRHRVVEFVAQGNLLWSSDGGKSTVILTFDEEARQSGFYKLELETGATAKLLEKGQCYTCVNTNEHVSAVPNGKELVYFSQDSQHYDDLWISDFNFRSPRRLTHLNPPLDRYPMGKARLVEWRSLDGVSLQGSLLLPSGYEDGRRYPLIVWVYGGERGSDHVNHFGIAFGSVNNLQLLASRGYAVLFPDAPQQLGTPMADLASAVLPGVNRVIEMGIADPERLGVIGHSYGGYSALSLIVQSKRFKAAVVEDGTADLISAYGEMNENGAAFGTSIAEQGQELMGGTPWDYRDRYIENSPIFFLDRVQTPVLIVHGGSDTAVAVFLGDETFVGLRRLGKEVEYAKYEKESHSPSYWSYANQLDLCHRIITWFDDHLKKPQTDSARAER